MAKRRRHLRVSEAPYASASLIGARASGRSSVPASVGPRNRAPSAQAGSGQPSLILVVCGPDAMLGAAAGIAIAPVQKLFRQLFVELPGSAARRGSSLGRACSGESSLNSYLSFWGLDAKIQLKVGSVTVTVKQHTKGRLADSAGDLVAVGNVGGWLGVDGALAGGQTSCVRWSCFLHESHATITPGHTRWDFLPFSCLAGRSTSGVLRCGAPLAALHVDAVDELLPASRCGS